jgi:adenosylmethionine-8-amino-7-oxononanoate aminotransferase
MVVLNNNKLLRNFNTPNNEEIIKGVGMYLHTKKKKYFDMTSGLTGTSILGWSNPTVNLAINKQIKKIPHIDYKYFLDSNREKLARLLLSKAEHKLDRVFFVGGSGGEACEAAMKLSYQYNCAIGREQKKWFISRQQSYHGSGSDAMSLGDRPNLSFYKPFFPKFRSKIPEHNIFRRQKKNETMQEYENRSIKDLEIKILQLGAKNVSGFVAETMMGGLIGDVPPTKNYWKGIRAICDRYNVHLIIDEVWCGTGTTGKIYCIDWDKVTPDIIFMGKTLAAGYFPVSALVTKKEIEEVIKKKFSSIQFSTTHQGHSVGVAAALAVQKIIHNDIFLNNVKKNGKYLRETLYQELKNHEFFSNIRGRGLRNSLEYNCTNKHLFGIALTDFAKNKLNLLISAKWHRVCFCNAINVKKKDLDIALEKFILCFNSVSDKWTSKKIKSIKHRTFY